MGRIRRRRAARSDLIEIYNYIASESPERAAAYLMRIEDKLRLPANEPGLGSRTLPGHPEIRAFPVATI